MNLNTDWVLQVDNLVYKFLKRIPQIDSERLLRAILESPSNPFQGDIQKMKGESNIWRRRVDAFRFRYELFNSQKIIHVFLAERRSSKNYWFSKLI